MRIGILTFHNAHNYGATLQAYALRTVLRNNGHEVNIINYCNEKIETRYGEKLKIIINRKKILLPIFWGEMFKEYSNIGYAQEDWLKQYKNFKIFISEILLENNIKRINKKELADLNYDIYISGSDQIWSAGITGGLDSAYFLDFKTKARKISYAASVSSINDVKKNKQYFESTLSSFANVFVREITLKKELEKSCNIFASVTLDPTLLLNQNAYDDLLIDINEVEKYVFVYFVSEDTNLMRCAQMIAEKYNCKLIELHYYKQKKLRDHNQRADLGPREFLSYVKNSEYVLTNSFHGIIFSVIYQKQFYGVYSMDERKDGILNTLNLQSRHIKNHSEIDFDKKIDFNMVNKTIEVCRKESLELLINALK